MKVRTALVGINGYAEVHLEHLKTLAEAGRIELTAAVILPHERTPENTAWFHSVGCGIYDSLDEMFKRCPHKPDLVCLPVGIPAHEPLTVCCLAHGANVLVEKPAAGSLAAVDRMRRAEADSGGCFAAVGFQHIYARELQHIKRYLLSGRPGTLKSVAAMGIWPRNTAYYTRNGWAGKIKTASGDFILDSPVNNAFAHYLNLSLFLAGETFGQSAHPIRLEGQLYRARKDIEYFDTCGIQLRTESGGIVSAYFSHASDEVIHPLIRIECQNGSVRMDFGTGRWTISGAEGTLQEEGTLSMPQPDMFSDVVEKVSDRKTFTCGLDIAREHTFCTEWLYRHCTPEDVPSRLLTVQADDGQAVIRDLPKTFMDCFEKSGKLVLE